MRGVLAPSLNCCRIRVELKGDAIERINVIWSHWNFQGEQQSLKNPLPSIALLTSFITPVLNEKRKDWAKDDGEDGQPPFEFYSKKHLLTVILQH